jgi:hypothetical protein
MMTTTTTTTYNNNTTTQRKRAPEEEEDARAKEEERQRERWSYHVAGALFRKHKGMIRAANALFGTPEWVCPDLVATWFMQEEELDVTRHEALAEECLDDARAHAKCKGQALPPLECLPRGILESEALEPYLKRWKRDNEAAAAAAAEAAPTRARCAYPIMMDERMRVCCFSRARCALAARVFLSFSSTVCSYCTCCHCTCCRCTCCNCTCNKNKDYKRPQLPPIHKLP